MTTRKWEVELRLEQLPKKPKPSNRDHVFSDEWCQSKNSVEITALVEDFTLTPNMPLLIKSCYDSLMITNKHYRYEFIAFLLLSAITFGCSATKADEDITICTEPRPEVCVMVYTPVCGLRNVAEKEEWKTYSNACSACSDPTVIGYKKDACEAIGK